MGHGYLRNFRNIFLDLSPIAKILLLLLIILIFMFISTILSVVLAIPIFGHGLAELMDIIGNPNRENLAVIKFFQIIQSVFMFIVPALLAAWLFGRDTFGYLSARKNPNMATILLLFLSLFVAIPALNYITWLNSEMDLPGWMDSLEREIIVMEESATRLTELFIESNNIWQLTVNLVMVAILPAIGEEFLFRGVFQRLFTDITRNKHWGVIFAAFIFSFFHFQFFGFLPRFLLGLYFGYLLVWSGNIWIPVAAHLINNGLAVIYYYYSEQPMGETMLDNVGTEPGGVLALVISVVFTALLLYLIYRNEKSLRFS